MSGDEALARRAVACAAWRWMPGMVILDERAPAFAGRLFAGHDGLSATYSGGWLKLRTEHMHEWLPDLTDPATLGCLLALVREAWGDPGIVVDIEVMRDHRDRRLGFRAARFGRVVVGVRWHDSEAGALVAALEAAPKREGT